MDPKPTAVNELNGPAGAGIPGVSRRRLLIIAGVAALVGVVVAAVVLLTSGSSTKASVNTRPLKGIPLVVVQLPMAHPPSAQSSAAVVAAAKRVLPPGDVRIKVAELMAADTPARREQTIAALEQLPQDSLPVGMALGIAQLWAGDVKSSVATLEKVKHADMYGWYGTQADNLLNYRVYPGYPSYVLGTKPPKGTRAQLEQAVKKHPSDAQAWLDLAWKIQTTDRAQAIVDARRAQNLNPAAIAPQVAANVLAFDKELPAKSLGSLMTLMQQHPKDAQIRFHAALLLFWMNQRSDTIAQMRQVVVDDPHGIYAQAARVFITCLSNPSGSACKSLQKG
jgi:hypothetical protein